MQYAHSVSNQTLQQCIQKVGVPPSSRLAPCSWASSPLWHMCFINQPMVWYPPHSGLGAAAVGFPCSWFCLVSSPVRIASSFCGLTHFLCWAFLMFARSANSSSVPGVWTLREVCWSLLRSRQLASLADFVFDPASFTGTSCPCICIGFLVPWLQIWAGLLLLSSWLIIGIQRFNSCDGNLSPSSPGYNSVLGCFPFLFPHISAAIFFLIFSSLSTSWSASMVCSSMGTTIFSVYG